MLIVVSDKHLPMLVQTMRDPKNMASSNGPRSCMKWTFPGCALQWLITLLIKSPQVVVPYLPIKQGHQPTSTNYQLGQPSNHPSIHVDPRGGVPQLCFLLHETHELPIDYFAIYSRGPNAPFQGPRAFQQRICFKETPTNQTYSEYSNFPRFPQIPGFLIEKIRH